MVIILAEFSSKEKSVILQAIGRFGHDYDRVSRLLNGSKNVIQIANYISAIQYLSKKSEREKHLDDIIDASSESGTRFLSIQPSSFSMVVPAVDIDVEEDLAFSVETLPDIACDDEDESEDEEELNDWVDEIPAHKISDPTCLTLLADLFPKRKSS